MAQSNYNIPNESAPAVRAQLNAVFQSIATNNSGSSAPTTTFAHQWWYDTTTNILKQRNAADSAWIDVGTFDQSGGTFTPAGIVELSQGQVEDDTSTVFGAVSGQRLEQQTNAAFNVTGSAPKFACRAWVNFNGTTPTIRASGNVSSVTKNSTGVYTVNFATAMPDADYATQVSFADTASGGLTPKIISGTGLGAPTTYTTSAVRVGAFASTPDVTLMNVSVFR